MGQVSIYLCAFRSSDCCEATVNRVIEPGREFYVCMKCHRLCLPVDDRLLPFLMQDRSGGPSLLPPRKQ